MILKPFLKLFSIFNIHIFSISFPPNFFKNLLPIKVERELSVDSYLGNWSQVATSRTTKFFGTGIDFRNVSANYQLINQSNISVFNCGLNANKNYTSIKGYSYKKGYLETKRRVHFDGVKFDGSYWIVKLGPIKDGKYQYAIVSGPLTSWLGTRFSLYVLARDTQDYINNYEKEVLQWCRNNNFIFFWNEYVRTI